MTEAKSIGWGSTTFTYTQEQVAQIRKLLELNDQDIVKVFGILESPGKNAQGLLRLIQRIQQGKQ